MFFRRPWQLALQVSLWLAAQSEGTVAPVREIAGALGVPAPYLSKVDGHGQATARMAPGKKESR